VTFREKIIEKYINQGIEEFDSNPLAPAFLRRLAKESPDVFFSVAMKQLRANENSNALRFLTIALMRRDEVTTYVADPAVASREVAQRIFNRFLAIDPSFDVKLARRLPDRGYINHADAFDTAHSTRALDVLDSTSRGRRLLPILGHLPNAADSQIAAKATLFVGKRVQSPAWAAKLLSRPDERLRANAVEALWGLDSSPAVRLLEDCTKDRHNRVMGNALVGLHIVGHRSVDQELRSLARAVSPDYRSTAAWAMGKLGQGTWLEPLTAMVRDEHPQVRSMALRSLVALRREEKPAPQVVSVNNAEAMAEIETAVIEEAEEILMTPVPELRLDGSSFSARR